MHPQHWPEDLDYTGKKVVVIGSGATAVTLVPAMAGDAAHVTMLQRSPSYVFSLPAFDKISEFLNRFLSDERVYEMGRKRNIVIQRGLYKACRRLPRLMRRFLLSQVRRRVGPRLRHEPLHPEVHAVGRAAVRGARRRSVRRAGSGEASVVTDEIETFTETGILLKSGRHLEADIIVTATGLNLQMLGGMQLSVDGEARALHDQMTYKGILVEDIPNLAWMFGYTNAPWTLKSDIAGEYLVRLFRHMDDNGLAVATPRDVEGCALDDGMLDQLQSGYVQRAKDVMPRQGSKLPWKVLMHLREGLQDAARRSRRGRRAVVRRDAGRRHSHEDPSRRGPRRAAGLPTAVGVPPDYGRRQAQNVRPVHAGGSGAEGYGLRRASPSRVCRWRGCDRWGWTPPRRCCTCTAARMRWVAPRAIAAWRRGWPTRPG